MNFFYFKDLPAFLALFSVACGLGLGPLQARGAGPSGGCVQGFGRLAPGHIVEHVRGEAEFWRRWLELRRLNAAQRPTLGSRVRGTVEERLEALSDLGERARARPLATTGAVARDTALYVPRTVRDLYDTSRQGWRAWRAEAAELDGIGPWTLRLFVRARTEAERGQTGFFDLLRDPVSGALQPALVRRGLRTLFLGVRVPPPRPTATALTSIVGYGYLFGRYVVTPYLDATDAPNEAKIREAARLGLVGTQNFMAYYESGFFSSHSSAYSELIRHDRALSAWLSGAQPHPYLQEYLREGYFGALSQEKQRSLRAWLDGDFARAHSRAEIAAALTRLSAEERAVVARMFAFDLLLRERYAQVRTDWQRLQAERSNCERRREPACAALPHFDELFRRAVREGMESALYREAFAGLNERERELMSRALEPKFSQAGVSELSGLTHAARAEDASLWRLLQDLSAAEPRLGLRLAADYAREAQQLSARPQELETRRSRLQAIPEFCSARDCNDQASLWRRPDLPIFTEPLSIRLRGQEQTLRSESDYWNLMFTDPSFLFFAAQKIRRERSDLELLATFRAYLVDATQVDDLREQVLVAAEAATGIAWRRNPRMEIPKPPVAELCRLAGYGGENRSVNQVFQGVRQLLDQVLGSLPEERRDLCRAMLLSRAWDLQVLEAEIASRARRARTEESRQEARGQMLEHLDTQELLFQRGIRRCQNGPFPMPGPEVREQIRCSP